MSICTGLTGSQTIWVNNIYIQPDLTSLKIEATTCGQFTGLYVYLGNGFLTNTYVDISSLINNTDEIIGGSPSGRSMIDINVPASTLGLTQINTVVVVRFVNNHDDGILTSQETTKAVASYAGLYPCLIYKITHSDYGCSDCKMLNNAIMMWLLMDITTAYFHYDRISEGVDSYNKMLNICIENDVIFNGREPGQLSYICGQYGGIGCWIIDHTFVVGQPYIQ